MERTLKCLVEYDGTGLCGWQRQDNGPTVQQHIEEAIVEMTQEETTILGASRTDAGVHAKGQCFIFSTAKEISPFGFRQGLNTKLPDSIALTSVEEAEAGFHPRFDALGKRYRYTVLNREVPSPLLRHRSWHRPMPLDVEAMRAAAEELLGEHDFSAFRATGCGAHTPNRRIDEILVVREQDLVYIDVVGNAFLRNMVRIVAGTLVEVGRGRRGRQSVAEALASRDRRRAGQTAPAQGLCLEKVIYS